jgi:hypothetical protein
VIRRLIHRTAVVAAGVSLVVAGIAFVTWWTLASSDGDHDGRARFEAVAAELKSAYEITVTRANVERAPISEAQALRSGARGARFLGGESPSAHLVFLTDPHHGKETSGGVIPFSKQRLVWLVLMRHAEEVSLYGDEGTPFVTQPATAIAFVDANSGKVIQITTVRDL